VPQYFGELAVRGVVSSFLNLGTRKRREVSFKPWRTVHPYKDESKLAQLFLCFYKQHFQELVGDRRKSSTLLNFEVQCMWVISFTPHLI